MDVIIPQQWTTNNILHNTESNFFKAFSVLSYDQKQAIRIIYAYCRLADNIADSNIHPKSKANYLELLRDETEKVYSGKPATEFGVDLLYVTKNYHIEKKILDDLLSGVEMDIHTENFKTFSELHNYCYHVAGTVGIMCLCIFGQDSLEGRKFAVTLGVALQLTNIIRDISEDIENGRMYIPVEDFRSINYDSDSLAKKIINDKFIEFVHYQIMRAEQYYKRAWQIAEKLDGRALLPAKIMSNIYYGILQAIKRDPARLYAGKIELLNLEKVWIAITTCLHNRFSQHAWLK